MDIFFHDPDDKPAPPEEVRIRNFAAEAYPDGQRVRVYLEISPFQKRPSAEIQILSPGGTVLSSVSIIETIDPRLEMTMHTRRPLQAGAYTIRADLFYYAEPEEENGSEQVEWVPERKIVDKSQLDFSVP